MTGDKPSLRDWIKDAADELDVEEERLLFNSPSRDPMWKGTAADHRNAEWFARYWREAVAGRSEESVHVRGVHYVMIETIDEPIQSPSGRTSWTEYRNTTTCYSFLKDASVVARVLGYVPLDGIRDEDNDETVLHPYGEHEIEPEREGVYVPTGISLPDVPEVGEEASLYRDDVEGIADHLGYNYAEDLRMMMEVDETSQQPYHVEIWSEKTPPAVLHELAQQYGVNLFVTGTGDLSYQVAYNLGRRINEAGKPGVILYLSDFDPKGDNMATAMAGKLAWLDQLDYIDQRVIIKQLAVTADQIERYELPRTPIDYDADPDKVGEKAYQSFVNDWEERKGHGATELQALWRDEQRFADEIEGTLRMLYDDDLSDSIRDVLDGWRQDARETIAEAVEDESDVPEMWDDVEAWVGDFNGVLEDAAEVIDRLNELLDDDRYTEWTDEIEDTLEAVELPEVEPPDGEAEIPPDPLYDSERGYFGNIAEARDHEMGGR